MSEVERRTYGTVELRAVEGEENGKKPKKMQGYAARFNVKSDELGGFREVILPGAFDRALREGHDVRALVNHDSNQILGRTKAGTLKLSIDENGLHAEIDTPDTQVGRDAATSVARGDLSQMSFAFRTLTDQWRTEDGEQIRELVDVELFDVSVVAYPAYPQTEVHVAKRALDKAKEMRASVTDVTVTVKVDPVVTEALQAIAAQGKPEPVVVETPAEPEGVPNEINAARLALMGQ